MPENTLFTYKTEEDPAALRAPRVPTRLQGNRVAIDRFWNGDSAFALRGPAWANLTQVYSLWNQTALLFYFECWFSTSFAHPAEGRDEEREAEHVSVVLRPGNCEGCFEFSVDTAGRKAGRYVSSTSSGHQNWEPQMAAGVQFSKTERIWRMFLEIPYAPLATLENLAETPTIGDAWRLNLHRTAIWDGDREHLSWRPIYKGDPASLLLGHLIFLGAHT